MPCAARERNGVEVLQGYLDDPLPRELERRVDVITAVVPYVPTDSLRLLPRDVQAFEPRLALDGGPDGTDLLAEVVRTEPALAAAPAAGCCWSWAATRPSRSGGCSASAGSTARRSWPTRTATLRAIVRAPGSR